MAGCSGSPTRPSEPCAVTAGGTQILLPTELTVRRADTTEAVGNALVAKANGAATAPSPRAWTARNQPCAAGPACARGAHAEWLHQQGAQNVVNVDRDLLTRLAPQRAPPSGER